MDTDPLHALALRYPDLLTVDCECGGDGGTARYPADRGWCRRCFGPHGRRLKTLAELYADLEQAGCAAISLWPEQSGYVAAAWVGPPADRTPHKRRSVEGPRAPSREVAAAMLLLLLREEGQTGDVTGEDG